MLNYMQPTNQLDLTWDSSLSFNKGFYIFLSNLIFIILNYVYKIYLYKISNLLLFLFLIYWNLYL
jgi:hypothetical protein